MVDQEHLPSGKYLIKHQNKGEYLYVGRADYDEKSKYVLGWKAKNGTDADMVFNVHAHNEGEYYGLQSNKWNGFVAANTPHLDPDMRHVLMVNYGNAE